VCATTGMLARGRLTGATLASFAFLSLSGFARRADAFDPAECVRAHDRAQQQRRTGQREDRAQLAICASTTCPGVVQQECRRWLLLELGERTSQAASPPLPPSVPASPAPQAPQAPQQPTDASRRERPTPGPTPLAGPGSEPQISPPVTGQLNAAPVPVQLPVPVQPNDRFVAQQAPHGQHDGQQDRQQKPSEQGAQRHDGPTGMQDAPRQAPGNAGAVDGDGAARATRLSVPAVLDPAGGRDRPSSSSKAGPRSLDWVAPFVLGSAAGLALATGAYLGLSGRSTVQDLRETCAPGCDPAQVSSVRSRLLVADLTMLTGVLCAGATAWLLWDRPSAHAHSPPTTSDGFTASAAAGTLRLRYSGHF
jgi:hypothetical protein